MAPLLAALLAPGALAQEEAVKGNRFGSGPSEVEAPAGERYALLIGVDAYQDELVQDLRYAGNDARAMADALIGTGLFPEDNVRVMTPSSRDDLKPTRTNILRQLAWLESIPNPEQVVFFFSGHGFAVPQDGGQVDLLMPMDVGFTVPRETSVELEDVFHRLDAGEARQTVVLIDACRNRVTADGSKALPPSLAGTPLDEGDGRKVLYSTKAGEYSYEDEERELGAMTARFIDGLDGSANANGDDWISVNEAFTYTTNGVRTWAKDTGKSQRPYTDGPSSLDFALAPARPLAGGGAPPPPTPPSASLLHTLGGPPAAASYGGALASGVASAALWTVALRSRGDFYTNTDALRDGSVTLDDLDENPDITAARANSLGYAAQATTGLTLGLAATGLLFTFVLDDGPRAQAVSWTGSGLTWQF